MTQRSPLTYFKTSHEVIRLAVMLYVRFPLSLWNVEDLLHERCVDISHETVRYWWHRFGRVKTKQRARAAIARLCGRFGLPFRLEWRTSGLEEMRSEIAA